MFQEGQKTGEIKMIDNIINLQKKIVPELTGPFSGTL
jgi:hypothetical protein